MWWHGDIETVREDIKDDALVKKKTLKTKEDVLEMIGCPRVRLFESVYGHAKPCAVVGFSTAIDPEHGLGVLINGTSVLGLGYEMSVGPFKD